MLKEAQKLGYAEADPAADVEGWDARSKLCILAKMSFGRTLDENALWCQVPSSGLRGSVGSLAV